jgi:hypothetical protein
MQNPIIKFLKHLIIQVFIEEPDGLALIINEMLIITIKENR